VIAPLVATYRLQLEPALTLERAAGLAGYLADLGVSHAYTSPLLQATTGSRHGYDVTDPTRWSRDLGGREGLERMLGALRAHALGLVLDIVPNHLAASTENPWWRDVLQNGRASRFGDYFDIDWSSGPVVLPVLEEALERRIAAGAVHLRRRPHGIVVDAGAELPLAPLSLRALLAHAAREAGSPQLATLACSTWPGGELSLVQLLANDERAAEAVDAQLAALEADPAALADLLERQAYRLVSWRAAPERPSYRRFFDVSSLVGLRMEEPRVFEHTHAAVLELCARGAVDGLRIDHVDGLREPGAYLARLRSRTGTAPLWVEKILHGGERLDEHWPVAGTTGYEVAHWIDAVLLDRSGAKPLARLQAELTGEERDFDAIARAARLQVVDELFPAELGDLARRFARLALRHRSSALDEPTARTVVREVLGVFPVYRTYVQPAVPPTGADRMWIERATRAAAAHRRDLEPGLLELVHDLLLLRWPGVDEHEFVLRFQQLSPAVAAKGIEDTALYRDLRLLALNEVGGDPARFGASAADFHQAMVEQQERWPLALVALSTHDCKRSADVRARLLVLA
jgi:(1->4)-alpha-D-glucan 1-alpha-D-glucosylmutase